MYTVNMSQALWTFYAASCTDCRGSKHVDMNLLKYLQTDRNRKWWECKNQFFLFIMVY